jgi:hypothetical protein
MIKFTEMTDLDQLKAEKARVVAEIAANQAASNKGPKTPGRKAPSPSSVQLETLTRRLAALNMKISTAEKRGAQA